MSILLRIEFELKSLVQLLFTIENAYVNWFVGFATSPSRSTRNTVDVECSSNQLMEILTKELIKQYICSIY